MGFSASGAIMYIDCHTYIGHWPFRQLRGSTPRGLLNYMSSSGVERTMVSNINGAFYRNSQAANEELAAAIRPFPGKFVPFAVLNPAYPGWRADLETCYSKLGIKALRLYPQYHNYKLLDRRLAQLLEAAHGFNLPVAFTRWLEDPRERSWLDTVEELRFEDLVPVIADNPGVFLLLNANMGPMKEEHLQVFRKAEIYFDTVFATSTIVGWSGYDIFGLMKDLGPERFLFGSGYPFRDPVTARIRMELLGEMDQRTRKGIWGGNARRLLAL